MSRERTVAVTGATGQQGGAAARHLLEAGWKVRGLTRDVTKPASEALAATGVDVVEADNDDPIGLESAFEGADAVFSVQNYWLPGVGAAGEVRQGKNVADAAKAAGVKHLLYSSVGAAHRGMGQAHFASKLEIENYVKGLDVPFTILRPAGFIDGLFWQRNGILGGTYTGLGLPPEKTIQYIAVDDIGVFASLVLGQPRDFLGHTLEIAGDEITEPKIAETLTTVIGRPVTLAGPAEGDPANDETAAIIRFFNGEGYDADIPSLRKMHPGLRTFETWLRETGWEGAQPDPNAAETPTWP
jgi:uncharacterized protein YbjT (DUF2867 family)